MVVQHNISSLFAQNKLKTVTDNKSKASEQLSSGYRINRAADDAAGLTISEKMRWQIRGLEKASQNLSDGCSYVQVADGALNEVQSMMQRMKELSVQAANDTNTTADRMALQQEINQLTSEINRIFTTTEYNTIKIWDENMDDRVIIGTVEKPAGYANHQSLSFPITETNKLAVPVNINSADVALSGGSFRLQASADESNPATYGIIVEWDAYNGNHYTSSLIPWPTPDENGELREETRSFSLKDYLDVTANPELAGIDFTYSYHITETATLDDIANMLNGTSISCVSSNSFTTEVYKPATDNVSLGSTYINYAALLVSERSFKEYDDLFIEGVTRNNLTVPTGDNQPWIYTFNMDGIGEVKATSTSLQYYSYFQYGEIGHENEWWHIVHPQYGNDYNSIILHSGGGTVGSVKNALNGTASQPSLLTQTGNIGGTISITFSLTATNAFTIPGTQRTTHSVGSVTMTVPVNPTETVDSIIEKINAVSGFDIYSGNAKANTPSPISKSGFTSARTGPAIDTPLYKGTELIHIQSSARDGDSINLVYDYMSIHYLGINDLDVSSYASAGASIEAVDKALAMVSEQRAQFGAYQNRMEHAKSNVDNTEENTQSAESRIRDADLAKVMVAFSAYDIIQQAGQSMLAQGNQSKQRVLELLQ